MPVFLLNGDCEFPSPDYAEPSGLLAIGGDLNVERLLCAYASGIFPWFSAGDPPLWWSPDPRLILIPEELYISRSLRRDIARNTYRVTINAAFDDVIRLCSSVHRKQDGETWITRDMIRSYRELHREGYAISAEAWYGDELAGGLYGVMLGKAFFGESMFTRRNNASKVAFTVFTGVLRNMGCRFIDCQITTKHLLSLGAREIPRDLFLCMLEDAIKSGDMEHRFFQGNITTENFGRMKQ